jgi:NAD(P)-dependent dehydrogenase (short-subunit alcohol dehydrogenase family)
MRIRGARVVITGAGSGIGRATALRCASHGAQIVCVDIDPGAARDTADACAGAAVARACDVSDAAAVAALATAVETEDGPVDVLVNNAGVGTAGPFLEHTTEDWDWLIGVNLGGVAYGCHAFGAAMVERGRGHVVNVASGAAYTMSRDLAAYCASKAAVLALSRCLRADWASRGVGVSAICPGVINTPIAAHTRMRGDLAQRQDRIARAFRLGHSPDLVARAIVRAIEGNREVVPVGLESELAYRVLPFVPGRLQALATRTPLHRLVL